MNKDLGKNQEVDTSKESAALDLLRELFTDEQFSKNVALVRRIRLDCVVASLSLDWVTRAESVIEAQLHG